MDCTCDYILPTQPNWEQHYENCRVKWNTRENSECQQNNDGTLPLRNAHLLKLDCDILYHMGLDTQTHNLRDMFGDVKFVCVGGTKYRMKETAKYMAQILDIQCDFTNIVKQAHRFAMYKVGPILCLSHGMGVPSMTIALEELLKILYYAKAKDPIIFRLGTSGGIGVDPGTVVISSSGLSDTLEPCYKLAILGRERKFPCDFDKRLNQELMSVAVDEDFKTVIGVTLCANNFYRGEARTDGAFCDYSDADKQEFLQKLVQLGVTNMEMESTAFAAFTREAGVRSALVCVTFLDRLLGDQVTPDKEVLAEWQQRPAKIVGNYILKYYKK
ncbi:uridine phosphorylase 1-like isoform X1 [Zerene cesonia]|uniref:uridine phosphorylase 1-like isoform X1 n=1 Tax=Zerene cesonia TaxID=33412 RepID=UPI0018E57E63|nr:uridine phosphorylase 1-like isoform X1 [Zerene cesonia]